MAWKIERWLAEVFPGESEIYSEYQSLPPRELAIVCAAVLDVALAELLSLRLANHNKEIEEFLGINGDGRAPVGSFGSRIQLGLLVGILTIEDAAILRTIKELRNLFAHRVRVNFLSPPVLKTTIKLHSLCVNRKKRLIRAGGMSGSIKRIKDIGRFLPVLPEAGEGLLLSVYTIYHAYFHRMHNRINRVSNAISK